MIHFKYNTTGGTKNLPVVLFEIYLSVTHPGKSFLQVRLGQDIGSGKWGVARCGAATVPAAVVDHEHRLPFACHLVLPNQ